MGGCRKRTRLDKEREVRGQVEPWSGPSGALEWTKWSRGVDQVELWSGPSGDSGGVDPAEP